VASGDASDTIGRPVDNGQLGILDPDGRAIGLHLYDGLLKVVPVDDRSGALGAEMFNVRLEELNVIDMTFLAACAVPTVALLYEDAKHARHIKTYALGMRSKVGLVGFGLQGFGWTVCSLWGLTGEQESGTSVSAPNPYTHRRIWRRVRLPTRTWMRVPA